MQHEYEGIEYHSDGVGRVGNAAINVKDHGRYTIPEALQTYAESAWDRCNERFWEDAHAVAIDSGYAGVYSEGRSGGWLVPYHSYAPDKRDLNAVRQGSYYPDVDDIGERSRFRAFQRRIEAMVADIGDNVIHECEFLEELDREEERAAVASFV